MAFSYTRIVQAQPMKQPPSSPRPPSLAATLLLVAGIVVFVLAALASMLGLQQTRELTDQRALRYQSLLRIQSVLSQLKDIETGQRGFLITGEQSFLQPYLDARHSLDQGYRSMREQMADAWLPAAFWDKLDRLLHQRVQLAEENIRLRQQGRFWGDVEISRLEQGKRLMDAIRLEFDTLEKRRQDEVRRISADLESRRKLAFGITLGAGLLGLALMVGSLLLFLREQRLRLAAESFLATANQRLEVEVQARTRDLQTALDRIRGFATELDQGIETERRRLAREVHDQVGQIFTAMKLLVRSWQGHFADVPGQQRQFAEFLRLLDEGVNTARRITAELQPPLLDELGLGAALEHFFNKYGAPGGIACRVDIAHDALLTRRQATALFRIGQEALTNALRHAEAGRVIISDAVEAGHYRLIIEDDGRGLAPDAIPSFGMRGMEERAKLVGGSFALLPGQQGGSRVEVVFPVTADQEKS